MSGVPAAAGQRWSDEEAQLNTNDDDLLNVKDVYPVADPSDFDYWVQWPPLPAYAYTAWFDLKRTGASGTFYVNIEYELDEGPDIQFDVTRAVIWPNVAK
jgi:hypothetical protein